MDLPTADLLPEVLQEARCVNVATVQENVRQWVEPQTNTIAMVLVNAVIVTVAALYVILVRTLSVQLVTDVENAVTAMVQVNAPIAADQEKDNDNRLYHYIIYIHLPVIDKFTSMAGFFLKKQRAAIAAEQEQAMKLQKK